MMRLELVLGKEVMCRGLLVVYLFAVVAFMGPSHASEKTNKNVVVGAKEGGEALKYFMISQSA